MKLLIADDDIVSRTMLNLVTKKWGFDTILAEDGEEAWAIMQSDNAPNLLLLDWKMPKADGLSVCKDLRAQNSDNPPYIIILTSMSETEDIVKGLDSGANDYISKPFNNAELRSRLKVGERMLDLQNQLNSVNKILLQQSTHDALTGLLNHGAIIKKLQTELELSKREKQPLSVIMCDIDHFKKVNDTYGHQVGDIVLKTIAQRIEESLRPYDLIGRYGGEEFLILLHADGDTAKQLTQRIHKSLFSLPIAINENDSIQVSTSCGLTTFTGKHSDIMANDLLSVADKALYSAKNSGRNCTCVLDN